MAFTGSSGMPMVMIPSASPPDGVEPNFINPVSLADTIVAIAATTLVLTISLLMIRLYTTLRITRSAGYDDCAIVLATLFALAYVGLTVDNRGSAVHGWDFPISGFKAKYFKVLLASVICTAFGFFFSKISILFLLFRLFNVTRAFRYWVYAGAALISLNSLITIIVASGLCAPRGEESFGSLTEITRCARQQYWAVVAGVIHVIIDFYLLALPIPMLWQLQVNLKRKIGIMAIFMTGFIACVASVLSVAYRIVLLNSRDLQWNAARVEILSMVELTVAIMVACMPPSASFVRHFSREGSFISSLRSRFLSLAGSKTNSSKSESLPTSSDASSQGKKHSSGTGKYWRLPTLKFTNHSMTVPSNADPQHSYSGHAPPLAAHTDETAVPHVFWV